MPHDLVVKGGTIVDGLGGEPFVADLAIDGGRIAAISRDVGPGRRVVDADGMMVSPGFIDLHTHFDAQVGWDPDLTPVSWHGVTTALIGNCGFSFAPCRPGDRDLLAGMMEAVEDIPRELILEGLPWDWEDYGGYLDTLERLRPGINVAGLVGHCAVRFFVMGERAVNAEASDDERAQMARIVADSIDRGAVGFSTNRFIWHRMPDGRPVPGTFAAPVEVLEIAKQVAARDGVVGWAGRHAIINHAGDPTMEGLLAECDMVAKVADGSKCRMIVPYGAGSDPTSGQARVETLERLCAGRDITAITHVRRGGGELFGLRGVILAPVVGPSWMKLRAAPLAERLEKVRDLDFSARLVEEAKRERATRADMRTIYFLGAGASPDYGPTAEYTLAAMAAAQGEHWSETFLRLTRETDGRAWFAGAANNPNLTELARLLKSPHCIAGLGDAGAHVARMMDSGWASFTLSHWVRDTGLYSFAEAIRRMTTQSARAIGLTDRGALAVGMRADVNVFDPDEVAELQPEVAHDFPGGVRRYIQHATGYKATIVNGQVSVVDGEPTGARAGSVIRHRH